jgi:sortase A
VTGRDHGSTAVDNAAPARTNTPGELLRLLLRGLGQTLITAGVVVLLFVVYEVYLTNYFAHEAQTKVKHALTRQWTDHKDPLLRLPDGSLPTLPTGVGIANLYVPRLGRDYAWTIVQGTSDADLEKGPGHYAGTALPGQRGNFAVAGHRVGKGEPFLNLDQLRAGDAVIVETESHWYVYRVKGAHGDLSAEDADGIPGRQIVSPGDGSVLLAVPDHLDTRPGEALMTMTTCHPKFTAAKRMIVYAQLQRTLPRTSSTMPAQVTGLYKGVTG